ncbi:MAG TPA: M20/M25/M40 family metallo-hydrolase [Polyangiaceae bacterium]|nr:M20/M25/M40 family metallo-hydrolase [Polyangiaceae bacterium]
MTSLSLNEARFIEVLRRLVGLGQHLQNAPSAGLVPEERLAARVVLETLEPHIRSGFIEAHSLNAPGREDRPSLVLTVRGQGQGTVGFVGAHFDVVPADKQAEGWEREPFELWVSETGTLYGRGVTDCLGHVAVLTDLLAQLAESGTRPRRTLKVVLIANEEEAPLPEIGLDYVVEHGHMDDLTSGPVYWLDSADFGPTIGTGGVAMWTLSARGVTGHSGFTQNCVNALELGMAASRALVEWFNATYPAHPDEQRWRFLTSSTLKATVISVANAKVTIIPGSAVIQGDIRLTPFYDMQQVIESAVAFVAGLNRAIAEGSQLPAGFPQVRTQDGRHGALELEFASRFMEGIACHLDSEGLSVLESALRGVRGESAVKKFSMTGALPLVRELQRRGFDVQITGFGRASYYHAPNEQAELAHFRDGFAVLRDILSLLP